MHTEFLFNGNLYVAPQTKEASHTASFLKISLLSNAFPFTKKAHS
jgi:hypothetical protein